jgi:serine/threonine-protein kinase
MANEPRGICPNCDTERGEVGNPCPSPPCAKKGYHFVPEEWLRHAKEMAARKGRPVDPMLGRYLDRYLLIGKLGEGGMGAVFVARQRPLAREVAVKIISGIDITPTTLARFEREAKVISILDHPNIVKLFDYGVAELGFKVPFMAMEYVRHGKTLRRALSQIKTESGGAIPGDTVYAVFSQILNALQAAHNMGIIHRDMKPDNVMILPVQGNPYFVKILDFGLAKAVADVTGMEGSISHTGQFLGTPYYMAPEQAPTRGNPVVDHRADLYSVGVMLFEVFTGVRPFEGETALACTLKKVDPTYNPFSLPQAQALLPSLKSFLEKALNPDRDGRFQSAEAMLQEFRSAIEGKKTTAKGLYSVLVPSEERPKTPSTPSGSEMQDAHAKVSETGQALVGDESEVKTLGVFPTSSVGKKKRVIAMFSSVVLALGVVSGVFVLSKGSNPSGGGEATNLQTQPTTHALTEKATNAETSPVEVEKPKTFESEKKVAPQVMKVRFESVPAGAEVFEKGARIGKTPFESSLSGSQGSREFVFRIEGFEDEKVTGSVGDGAVVRATLRKKPEAPKKPKKVPSPGRTKVRAPEI